MRSFVRGFVALVSVVAMLALVGDSVRAAQVFYPDLVADWGQYDGFPAGTERLAEIKPPEELLLGDELRLVVRFDGYVSNIGAGPVWIRGNPQNDSVYQWLKTDAAPIPGRKVTLEYETYDGHNHWHLKNAMTFSLWDESQTTQVTAGAKVGFCLYDINRIGIQGPASAFYTASVVDWCDSGNQDSTEVEMGTSAGWSDIYRAHVAYQWVDVSEVAPGEYYLAAETDASDQIEESDETNNGLSFHPSRLTIVGWLPQPDTATTLATTPVTLSLGATRYGTPGPAVYEIVDAPANGTASINPSTGVATYAAKPGFHGSDRFTYTAYQKTRYPLTRPTATVTVGVDRVPGTNVFVDDDASVFEADIEALASAGVTRGCNPPVNDRFCPDEPVSRDQLAAFLVRALGYSGGGDVFVDDDGSVFEADVEALAAAGVTRGCNPPVNDRFCPDEPVSRGQLAAFLVRIGPWVNARRT